MNSPLHGLRVAVTIPPPAYFGGVDRAFAIDMADELCRQGATVMRVEVAAFVAGDQKQIDDIIVALRSFRPEVAFSLPNGGYAIVCTTAAKENVFRDILQVPTILIWDHGALQFSQLLLAHGVDKATEEPQGCLEILRRALDHPLYIHYSPDRGHIMAMEQLGIMDSDKVRPFIHFAFPAYTRSEQAVSGERIDSHLAFVGNVYLDMAEHLPYRTNPILADIEARMIGSKKADTVRSLWEILLAEIGAHDRKTREELGLHPDSTFFWRFMYDEIEAVGNTHARLGILADLQLDCDFYGNFMEPQMASTLSDKYGIRFRGSLDCVSQLPSLYRHSDLIVDVINAGYISGTSPKVTSCLASGGLILFDYKSDFRQGVGDVADALMYRSVGQLNSMVEEYLSNPRRRRELTLALQECVLKQFTFRSFSERVLVEEAAWCA